MSNNKKINEDDLKVLHLVHNNPKISQRGIAEQMGFSGKIIYDDSKPDGQPRRCLDTTRAEEVLGFKAKTDLQVGLKQTIEWFLKKGK